MDFITREKKFNGARGDIEARQLSKKDKIQLGQQVGLIEDSLVTNGSNNKSNRNGKMTNGKMENNSSTNSSTDTTDGKSSSHCSRLKCILFTLMGILLVISAITIAIVAFTLFDNEDQCFNQNSPFQQPNYKLFSTKTLYLTAFTYLSKLSSSPASVTNPLNGANTQFNNNNNNNLNLNYDKSSIYLPKIFSQQDSLESLNQRLTSPEFGCKVKQLHFFGRHAARLPSSSELEKINKHIADVQSRIDLAKYLNLSPTNSNGQQSQQLAQTAQPNVNANGTENKTEICFDPLVQFKQWSSFAVPEQGNLLMETGAKETQAIALRFKSIFPELFDSKLTKIELGTTEELRTAQTALAFIKQFDNFNLDFCDLNEFPIENTSDKTKAYEIQQNGCLRTFLKKFVKDKLSFHKKCQQYHQEDVPISYGFNLKNGSRTEFISQSVSKKLKLSKDDQLTGDEVHAIYNACRYESALLGSSSIWCNLFTERDLKFYEYLNDIDDYFNQAYGHPDMYNSACAVTRDMMSSFKLARQEALAGKLNTEAHFYFTHSEVIQKILAASVDLEHDPEYSPKQVVDHLRRGTTPKERQWQTSLFTPFSANIAFTLYSCPKNSAASINNEYLMDVSPNSPMKVVASLNEQPIMLEGCKDYICDLNELLYESRLNREKKCKLEELCQNNHIFT